MNKKTFFCPKKTSVKVKEIQSFVHRKDVKGKFSGHP